MRLRQNLREIDVDSLDLRTTNLPDNLYLLFKPPILDSLHWLIQIARNVYIYSHVYIDIDTQPQPPPQPLNLPPPQKVPGKPNTGAQS